MKSVLTLFVLFAFASSVFAQERGEKFIIEAGKGVISVKDKDIYVNCGSIFMVETEQDGNLIKIFETDTSTMKMHCVCYFDLNVDISNLEGGVYKVELYRKEYKEFMYPEDKVYLLASETIEVAPVKSLLSLGISFKQSDCLNNPSSVDESSADNIGVFPNPASGAVLIKYRLDRPGIVSAAIYDLFGREVRKITIGPEISGENSFGFDAAGLNDGVYGARLFVDGVPSETFRFVVAR